MDTGSTYNFARPALLKRAQSPESSKRIALADGSQVVVGFYSIHLRVQTYSAVLPVYAMTLPSDFDIILGDQWCVQAAKAALVYDSKLCRTCSNTLKEHFLYVPK